MKQCIILIYITNYKYYIQLLFNILSYMLIYLETITILTFFLKYSKTF